MSHHDVVVVFNAHLNNPYFVYNNRASGVEAVLDNNDVVQDRVNTKVRTVWANDVLIILAPSVHRDCTAPKVWCFATEVFTLIKFVIMA